MGGAGGDRDPGADGSGVPYEAVIGLEIHVQLATRTKMFCGDRAEYGAPPNTLVCPVCLGLPGSLPVVNGRAVELAVRAALALECTVHEASEFARKNYFYPDLPKGYQISQYDRPLATEGRLEVPGSTEEGESDEGALSVRIQRVHVEEDTGKSTHALVAGGTAVDLNRAGVPLIEIVTRPDLRTPAQARRFLAALKELLEYLEVSDCDMETGSLRVDANISVRPAGSPGLGPKTEIKNLNSFANVERALRFEHERQSALAAASEKVVHETLLWDADRGIARPMRSKESAHDYRYFPEPDLPPLVLPPDLIPSTRADLPELPAAKRARFRTRYGLPAYDAEVLTGSRMLADYFEAVASAADPKAASNWLMSVVLAWLNDRRATIEAFPVPADRLAELIRLVEDGTLSSTMGRRVLDRMVETGSGAPAIVEAEGLAQVSDQDRLSGWVQAALTEHPAEAERLDAGETQLVGFFMGVVMRASGGKADPKRASAMLRERAGG